MANDWEELRQEATSTLIAFLQQQEHTSQDLAKAKLASSALSSITRHEQTQSAREATAVLVGRHIYEDKNEFAEYLRIATPELKLPIPKQLA